MARRSYTDEALTEAVALSRSIGQVLAALKLKGAGGNYRTIPKRIQELGLDTSHFSGQRWRKGVTTPPRPARALVDVLREGITFSSSHLRRRLLKEGIKEHQCEQCLLRSWQGVPIVLELEHINGRHDDNRIDNLQLLCPNCHALTPTWRRKKSAGVVELDYTEDLSPSAERHAGSNPVTGT